MLNEDESDDPRAMMQQARGGMPADRQGQRPPGGVGHGGQGGGRGGGRGSPGGDGLSSVQQLIQASTALNIVQDDSTVIIAGNDGTRLVFYPDGRKIEYPVEDLGNVVSSARWVDDKFVVSREVENGPRLTVTYTVAGDRKLMFVDVRVEGGELPRPMSFRRVYDAEAKDS